MEGNVIIFLQMRKLKLREVKWLVQGHMVIAWAPSCSSPMCCAVLPVGCGRDVVLLLSALVELQLLRPEPWETWKGSLPSVLRRLIVVAPRGGVPALAGGARAGCPFPWLQGASRGHRCVILATSVSLVLALGPRLKNRFAISHPFPSTPSS